MKTNSEMLLAGVDRAIQDGEMSYRANRNATKAFDIFLDEGEGKTELLVMLEGIDIFIADIEALGRSFETVSRTARAALR